MTSKFDLSSLQILEQISGKSQVDILEWAIDLVETNKRLLKLLKQVDRDLGFCIICRSDEIDWSGMKVHKSNCELAKELGIPT